MVNLTKLNVVLTRLKEARERWCAKEVDDAEEMWIDIPEMLDEVVPMMEEALAGQNIPSREDCSTCAKVLRHPGEGFACGWHDTSPEALEEILKAQAQHREEGEL